MELREVPGQQAGVARGLGERGATGRPEQSWQLSSCCTKASSWRKYKE